MSAAGYVAPAVRAAAAGAAAGVHDVDWVPVVSSNVQAVGYIPTFRRLFVRFLSGAVYRYEDVPQAVYLSLLAAGSKGQALDRLVKKGGYGYTKVSG